MDERSKIIQRAEKRMGRKINRKYVPKSLSIPDLRKQIRSIEKGEPRPKTKTPSRKSKWTIKAQKYFGEGKTSKEDMATKLARGNATRKRRLKEAFDQIYDKGMKAYQTSGSRPNQTPQSWGQARVFSVLFGGASRKVDDAIVKKYRLPLLTI